MTEATEGRPMLVAVYKSKPVSAFQRYGYWFIRVTNTMTDQVFEHPTTERGAEELQMIGVPRLADGGGK